MGTAHTAPRLFLSRAACSRCAVTRVLRATGHTVPGAGSLPGADAMGCSRFSGRWGDAVSLLPGFIPFPGAPPALLSLTLSLPDQGTGALGKSRSSSLGSFRET